MKVNVFLVIISIGISAFAAYGFYSQTNNLLLTIGAFVLLAFTLCGILSVSVGPGSVNLKVLSGIFFLLFLGEHLFYTFKGFSQVSYIIVSGILFLVYIGLFYGISKALKNS